MKGGKVK